MGGCASLPLKFKKGGSLPSEPTKEDAATGKEVKAEEVEKKGAEVKIESKEVVDEHKGTSSSLENLLDQDEKKAEEPKKEEELAESDSIEAEEEKKETETK